MVRSFGAVAIRLVALVVLGASCAGDASSPRDEAEAAAANALAGAANNDYSQAAKEANFSRLYASECAVCHGDELQGASQGPALVGRPLTHGDRLEQLAHSIASGYPEQGMPAWSETLSDVQRSALAFYISEQRAGFSYVDYGSAQELDIPKSVVVTERHRFVLEPLVEELDPLPFSIAPLPDGRILVTEKMRGLRVVGPDGRKSELIQGTPAVYGYDAELATGLKVGSGWMMDVALHPDYAHNGWVYLVHGDRCTECSEIRVGPGRPGMPVSMNRLLRARIRDGRWLDEEVIWEAPKTFYGPLPDVGAGGRIAFDTSGHVFFSVGMKGFDNHTGIQDPKYPWGKIHRVHEDGRIPDDNPFVGEPDAMQSLWTFGHRNPMGLEFDAVTQQLWSSENGPRGGDEINLLLPGRNYGWPLYSKGLNYNGTPVDYGPALGIEFDLEDLEQPVVDMTPSPAVSSFVIYRGDAFPEWRGEFLVGSLKASALYRMTIRDGKLVHRETLIDGLARIRDVEVDRNGHVLLLLEHASGGKILRLVPSRD